MNASMFLAVAIFVATLIFVIWQPRGLGIGWSATAGALVASVEGRSGLTPYARWAAAWSLWPLWALALAVVAGLALRRCGGDGSPTPAKPV